jgi:HAD superfamily hydrolase (TIGR01549 family)
MRPKVITLDITGTLLTPNKSIAEIYTQSAAKVGIKISNLDTLSNAFNRAYRECNDLFPNFGHGQLPSSRQWWYQVVARTFSQAGYNLPYQQQDILFETIYSDFALSDHYHIYSDVIPFLNFIGKYNDYIKDPQRRKKLYEGQREKLQSCLIASSSENEDDECILSYAFHYQPILVGIISNGDARYQDSILPLLNISRYINFCVVSGNLGSRKPDYPIFDTARIKANQLSTYLGLGQQTIETQDCLHVGDSLNEDIIGAMNANFSAAYMLRDPRHEIVMDAYLEKKKLCQDGENNIHTKTTRYENNQNENHKDDKDDQNENHHNKNPPNTTDPDCNEINKMDNLDEIIQDYQTMQDLTHDRLKHLQANGIGIGVEKGSIITFRNFLQLRDAFFHDILDKL